MAAHEWLNPGFSEMGASDCLLPFPNENIPFKSFNVFLISDASEKCGKGAEKSLVSLIFMTFIPSKAASQHVDVQQY